MPALKEIKVKKCEAQQPKPKTNAGDANSEQRTATSSHHHSSSR
jgi:hypothetical protein